MKDYSAKHIVKLAQEYQDCNQASFDRGIDAIDFVQNNNQWDPKVVRLRNEKRSETLTFNMLKNVVDSNKAKAKNIDLSINLNPLTDSYDIEESKAFKLILKQIMFNQQNEHVLNSFNEKAYDFGSSVMFVNVVRENDLSLNNIIKLEMLKDPRNAFFDPLAPSPTRHDGGYCGIRQDISRDVILKAYPRWKSAGWLGDSAVVIDFWYKKLVQADFVLLESGEYKRSDLLVVTDVLAESGEIKKADTTKVFYKRIIEGRDIPLESELPWPGKDLPLIFHYGFTSWTDSGYQTYPLTYYLQDAQMLLNYSGSQLATQVKNITADKWFFNKSHVQSDKAQDYARNINTKDGGFIFDDDPGTIRRENTLNMSPVLLEFFQQTKSNIKDINGAFFSQQNEIKAASGVALDKMFNRMDILQNNVIQAYIHCVDVAGHIIQGMIPDVYTETRTLLVEKNNGVVERIQINAKKPTGTIVNNVKDINTKFHYSLSAGVSSELQKQNSLSAFNDLYSKAPQAIPLTIDLYVKAMDIPGSEELSRRFAGVVDPELIKYSQGEISEDEYMMDKKKESDQQSQWQSQISKAQMDLAQAKVKTEEATSQAMQYEVETKRMKALLEAEKAKSTIELDKQKMHSSNINEMLDREIKDEVSRFQHQNAILKAGHGDD